MMIVTVCCVLQCYSVGQKIWLHSFFLQDDFHIEIVLRTLVRSYCTYSSYSLQQGSAKIYSNIVQVSKCCSTIVKGKK
jgi:hypothetical protein